MSNPTVSSTADTPGATTKRRRRRTLLAVAGVVVAAAAIAAVIGYNDNWGKTAPAAPPAAAGGTADSLGGTVVHPSPSSTDTAGRTAAPNWKDVTFDDFHGSRLPVSPAYGPKTHTATRAAGFSHNLGGAVEAAVHLCSRVSPQAGPNTYGPAVEQQMTGDTVSFRAQLDRDYQEARQSSGLPDGTPLRIYSQVIGYAAAGADASGQTVTLHLISRGANPTTGGTVMGDFPVTLDWVAGDWKVRAPLGGQWPFNLVSSTAGYTLFPGVNGS